MRSLRRARVLAPVVALVIVVAGALTIGALRAGSGDGTSSPGERAHALAAQLRCPVCQGQSVADSPSPAAGVIAADIERRVAAGERDATIKAAYVATYGRWILLSPERSGLGALVWALPVLALAIGAAGLGLAFARWRRQAAPPPSAEDRDLVARALEQR